jgi:hypothetical protein
MVNIPPVLSPSAGINNDVTFTVQCVCFMSPCAICLMKGNTTFPDRQNCRLSLEGSLGAKGGEWRGKRSQRGLPWEQESSTPTTSCTGGNTTQQLKMSSTVRPVLLRISPKQSRRLASVQSGTHQWRKCFPQS